MDTFATLYERLRQRTSKLGVAGHWPAEPPLPADWLRYWNDAETDLGNLRNLEHWLSRTRREGLGHNPTQDAAQRSISYLRQMVASAGKTPPP